MNEWELLIELAKALNDHHTGMDTTRPFAQTYKRDEDLLRQVKEAIARRKEQGGDA